jgi:hypothetical protein
MECTFFIVWQHCYAKKDGKKKEKHHPELKVLKQKHKGEEEETLRERKEGSCVKDEYLLYQTLHKRGREKSEDFGKFSLFLPSHTCITYFT